MIVEMSMVIILLKPGQTWTKASVDTPDQLEPPNDANISGDSAVLEKAASSSSQSKPAKRSECVLFNSCILVMIFTCFCDTRHCTYSVMCQKF